MFQRMIWVLRNLGWLIPWLFKRGRDRYLFMQRESYDYACKGKGATERIVGNYKAHNEWADYDEFLMKYIDESFKDKIAMEFGCGPGRNIIKYHKRFKRIDGCDISPKVLDLCLANVTKHKGLRPPTLYPSNGDNISKAVASDYYDFVFSTITLQHICVHSIRQDIFKDIFRILMPGGRFTAQMGFGDPSPMTVHYNGNNYDAPNTNRACDVRIRHENQLRFDLECTGFVDFAHVIRPVGPGDIHPNWIFFTATKPGEAKERAAIEGTTSKVPWVMR